MNEIINELKPRKRMNEWIKENEWMNELLWKRMKKKERIYGDWRKNEELKKKELLNDGKN